MSFWSSVVGAAINTVGDAARFLPGGANSALPTQVKIFGSGAEGVAAVAEAEAHNHSSTVALIAVGVGIAAGLLIPGIAVATVVGWTLPLLGGIISQQALTIIVTGALSATAGVIAGSLAEWSIGGIVQSFENDLSLSHPL